jgi:lysozyme
VRGLNLPTVKRCTRLPDSTLRASRAGIALIKEFEGFRSSPYRDTGGVWTIGYGTTLHVDEHSPDITKEDAELLLKIDMRKAERAVEEYVLVPLSQSQIDALVSLCYNIGNHAFKTSTLCRLLNASHFEASKLEFARWKFDNGSVIPGLVRRRKREADLFDNGLTP